MNRIKNEIGITLIALIITIIILVILAAVSIRAVYNMGIVNHAVNGTQEYAIATKDEEKIMNNTENFLESTINKINPTIFDDNPGVLEGSGTTADPYVINSIEDLVALSYSINTGETKYREAIISLGRNLDFNEDSSYANAQAKYSYQSNMGCYPDSSSQKTIK